MAHMHRASFPMLFSLNSIHINDKKRTSLARTLVDLPT
jgi:hypothetical protein